MGMGIAWCHTWVGQAPSIRPAFSTAGVILSGVLSMNGAFFATALASGIATIAMGLVANAPIALAP